MSQDEHVTAVAYFPDLYVCAHCTSTVRDNGVAYVYTNPYKPYQKYSLEKDTLPPQVASIIEGFRNRPDFQRTKAFYASNETDQ